MKRILRLLTLVLAICLASGAFASCMRDEVKGDVLKVAVLEAAYGKDVWKEVTDAFSRTVEGVTVELTAEKNLEDIIGSKMKSGDYPDVVHLATGREMALTETMIKDKALESLDDVLEMTVPGENVTVKDKLIPGFTDTLATNPYGDGETYLAPMFYSPCGLFYNAGLFEQKGWKVPETWDEMWSLAEVAKKEGIALFTYPTHGYFDSLMYALLCETGGVELYNKCMNYEEGAWDSPEAAEAFKIIEKLSGYVEKTTVANANNDNYLKNQQLVMTNKALFMPNGTWVVEEMKDTPAAEGFKWGFMALPAVTTDRYSYAYFEQCWIPKEAENKDMAEKFIAFLYSDEAVKIFSKYGAIQPVKGASEYLTGDNKLFYSIYEGGAKAVMGGFAATEPVEGVNMSDTLFGTINSIVTGDKTVDEWRSAVSAAGDKLRGAKK